jgi:hypothetical protein
MIPPTGDTMLDDREIAETIQRLTDNERNTIYETFDPEKEETNGILLENLRDSQRGYSDYFNGKSND